MSDGPRPTPTPPIVRVPSIVGNTPTDARALLRERGLGLTVLREVGPRPWGEVVSQDPEAGVTVRPGDRVHGVVREGVRVPNVIGMEVADARSKLEEAGLEPTATMEDDSYDPAVTEPPQFTVLATDPEAGTHVEPGSVVEVTYWDPTGGVD